jgi:hypothetical protein
MGMVGRLAQAYGACPRAIGRFHPLKCYVASDVCINISQEDAMNTPISQEHKTRGAGLLQHLSIWSLALLLLSPMAWAGAVDQAMAELKRLEPMPDQIHAIYDRIEKERVLTYKDDATIDKSLVKYANGMRNSFNRIVKLSQAEAKSEGKEHPGAVKALTQLEEMAKQHEKKVAAIEDRAKKLDTLIRNGDVRLDEGMLKRMSKEDREEFLKYVSEPVRKEYLEKYKDLFAAWVTRFADLISSDAQIGRAHV